MRLVFCGTPAFGVDTLQAVLAAGHEVALVVAQPDRAAGRGMEVQSGAVKSAALRLGLPLTQPEKIKNNLEFRAALEAIRPDAILVVAYGRIIPDWMLALPPHGCINLHGSLLPKYRGAAPIQWAVANGDTHTGVTTMLLEAGLDTGPMLLAERRAIAPEENSLDLFLSLAEVGAGLMVRTLAGLASGKLAPVPQDHTQATLAPILVRDDGRMDFTFPAKRLIDRWRGFQPWPGAWTTLKGKKLIVHTMKPGEGPIQVGESDARELQPGELQPDAHRLLVGCASGTSLELLEVQLEGKKRMTAANFLHGFQLGPGERLGE